MKEKLDLRGMLCPQPVIAAKKLLDKPETELVEALVDDEICVANLERLARSLKASISISGQEGHYSVCISKNTVTETTQKELSLPKKAQASNTGNGTVIFITKDQMGDGDPEFSKTLLNVFLQSLFEGAHSPRAILMANSGVKLMSKDSPTKRVLQDFLEQGTEVLVCGLCVDFYGLKDEINKEQITNMFAICEYLNAAEKVLQF